MADFKLGLVGEFAGRYPSALARVTILERLAGSVRRLRKEKGWSQEQLVFEADVHRTYVSQLERAKRNPTATMIGKLARPLGVAPGRLLD